MDRETSERTISWNRSAKIIVGDIAAAIKQRTSIPTPHSHTDSSFNLKGYSNSIAPYKTLRFESKASSRGMYPVSLLLFSLLNKYNLKRNQNYEAIKAIKFINSISQNFVIIQESQ